MSKVEITEIFCKGTVKKTQADEYLEITNHGNEPEDLSAWRATSSGKNQVFFFPTSTVLEHRI
jgi:hypothetical protein